MEEKAMTNEQAYEIAMKAIDEAYENERPLLYLIPPKEDIQMVELSGTINMHEPEPFDECDYEYPNGEKVDFRIVNDYDVVTVLLPCEN